jgi:hypothetical protein
VVLEEFLAEFGAEALADSEVAQARKTEVDQPLARSGPLRA